MSQFIYQIPFTINQDWTVVKSLVNRSIDFVNDPTKVTEVINNGPYLKTYMLGPNLSVSHVNNGSEYWYMLNGSIILNSLKWLPGMIERFKDLDVVDIHLNKLINAGVPHIDTPESLTALNYFFNTSNAITYVKHDNIVESYPTVKNTGWLLDIQKLHWIENTEPRTWFSIRFGKSFDYCKDWFMSQNFTKF